MTGVYGHLPFPGRLAACIVVIALRPLVAAPPADPLAAAVHATWRSAPLAAVALRLGELADTPVVVDRRLDPTTKLSIEADGRTVSEVLDELAEAAGAEWVELASSVRIVPHGTADRLAAAEADRRDWLARLSKAERSALVSRAPLRWETGSTPVEIVRGLADEGRFDVDGLTLIPHDHLPAASLPPMPLADRLDLVLAHYDLQAVPGGSPHTLRIEPLGPARAVATKPTRPRKPQAAAADSYTLRTEAPLEQLLRTVAKRLGLELVIDRGSLARKGVAPGVIVRLSIEDAPRDRLLDAILEPNGLGWSIEGGRLTVR